ncbi:MAG: hypothetical protein MI685_10345 [Chlorobiales bacterium]|nr:hypothetical protein [Chlorobiales bacterium]
MMQLLPVRQIRVDTAGESFGSVDLQAFGYHQFEPGTYSKTQLKYMHQSGHSVPYGFREELVADLVDFSAADYVALLAFGSVDVEITMGLPGETATVVTFLATRIQLDYNVTEGVQKLKLTAQQFSTAAGVVIPVTTADFGYGVENPQQNRFSLDLIECRGGIEVLKKPFRTGDLTGVERILGFKRKAAVTIAPTSAQVERQGFGTSLEAWLMSANKFFRAYNFFGETSGYDSYREVVLVQEELDEERLENLLAGKNVVLQMVDKYKHD